MNKYDHDYEVFQLTLNSSLYEHQMINVSYDRLTLLFVNEKDFLFWFLVNKKVNEKIILLSIIGSLDAIKEEAVSIDEIEKFLFSPHIYHKLKQKGYSGDILQIIEEGCELEDIFSLLPDKFDGVIDNMRRKSLLLLKNYEEYNHFFWLDE